MKTHILRILVDSLDRISAMDTGSMDRYFLLYDSFSLFLSQVVRKFDPPSFESHSLPFSLYGYLCHESRIPEHLRFAGFKLIRAHTGSPVEDFSSQYDALYWLTVQLAEHFFNKSMPQNLVEKMVFPSDRFWVTGIPQVKYPSTKVVLLSKKSGTDLTFHAYWVDHNGLEVLIRPDKIMRIKNQVRALKEADKHLHFPMTVELFDVVAQNDVLTPGAMVFLPDYLIDITSVSQCFTPFGEMTTPYLLSKIRPYSESHYLLIGNCVNQLLDELIFQPGMEWEDALPMLFRINELTWATYSDRDTRQHLRTIGQHFTNLKNTIRYEFIEKGFQQEYCAVEPSFYSPKYGLQGRLDLLYDHPDPTRPKMIIELKSGKIFRPNSYGLNHPHYIQTLLYDLLIRSAYPDGVDPVNYILYSAEEKNNLRNAPAIRDWQMEALGVRNQLIILECRLAGWSRTSTHLYEILKEKNENLVGYAATEREDFYKYYEASAPVSKAYFNAFLTFLTREQMTSKLGAFSSDRKGQSQLWASSSVEKDQQYLLLGELEVEVDRSQDVNPIVIFRKTSRTNPLANFRTGDVILTYPADRKNAPVQGQLFRCSLVENSTGTVTIRLRARQYKPIFLEGSSWYIEHDHLDSSFRQMNQSLVKMLRMSPQESQIFLGISPPAQSILPPHISSSPGMTDTQIRALSEMKNTLDYYLLWGPPGTGKTSVLLRNFVADKLAEGNLRLLLIGFTNRAVDEICAALLGIGHLDTTEILRIGSRYGTDPEYRHLLLHERNQKLTNRAGLLEMLAHTRVVCGTIASLSGQNELFDLIRFDYIVIDEASQILEPALIGFLNLGIPYILIGDHKQLPAVVNQSPEDTYTNEVRLHDIGLHYLSNSYFERIFQIAQRNQWEWAYGILTHQGRMHRELMAYPNQFFYENILEILPFDGTQQSAKLGEVNGEVDELDRILSLHRTVYIPTREQNFINHKINPEEASRIVRIIRSLQKIRPTLSSGEIGIITPYRAQIATIRHAMAENGIDQDGITVDTVERYQGGAKDVIIISYCINAISQVHQLMESMTSDGVDRKLNVAMTRAREQIIFLANEALMCEHPLYEALLYQYTRCRMEE